ncbi:MAG TPA: GxxExxY protein [Oceanospirillales bacterium]|nr:GxxExxY protein [Oceanospirillales bacterium]
MYEIFRLVIIELKSVKKLTAIDEAQILTYMKLANIKTGLLINFNANRLVDGLKRYKL